MYRRTSKYVTSHDVEVNIFIEGHDYVNSELLYKLDQVTDYEKYIITKYEHRIDLISADIYGTSDYSWILMYINRINISDLIRGLELKYIPFNRLNLIISNV